MFLNRKILINSPPTWRRILNPPKIQNSLIFTISKRNDEKNSLFSNTCLLSAKNSLSKIQESVRPIVMGGPGYTKFAHGRYKGKLSTIAYFWYAFLIGSLGFVVCFDFD